MKQVGLFHPYKRKYRRIISTFRLLFIHTRSTVAGSAVMSGIRIAFSTCRSGAIDLSGGTLSAFDPLGILFGRQNRLHPAGHLFTLLCHRFTRFFSHLPAFGPVLPHGLSLFQANRVNLFYLFVRERQVFFHPVGHLFRNLLRSKFFVFGTTIMVSLLGPYRTRCQHQRCQYDDQEFRFHINYHFNCYRSL